MPRVVLLKRVQVYDQPEVWLAFDAELPVLPRPGTSIFVGPNKQGRYDEDGLRSGYPLVVRTGEDRVFVHTEDFVWDEHKDRRYGDGTEGAIREDWVAHYCGYGWRVLPRFPSFSLPDPLDWSEEPQRPKSPTPGSDVEAVCTVCRQTVPTRRNPAGVRIFSAHEGVGDGPCGGPCAGSGRAV